MIGIVTILYNPSTDDLQHLSKMASVHKGVIVDNSQHRNFESDDVGKMHYIPLMDNYGIAEAQNRGIRYIMDSMPDVSHIVFMDQDSRCEEDYADWISEEYQRIKAFVPQLAILGPMVVNKSTGEAYASSIHKQEIDGEGFGRRREIISSGSCVAVDVMRDVGLMEGEMFIDFVDFEWCWRAQAKGYVCGVTKNVTLDHQVGQKELSIGAYKVIVSAPIRYYYQYRNHLWLCRRMYVPTQWKIATGIKHMARLLYFPLIVKNGREYAKYMIRGINDAQKK